MENKAKGEVSGWEDLRTGEEVIRQAIKDICLAKRLLIHDGVEADEIDKFIEIRSREYDEEYSGMTEDVYDGAVAEEFARVKAIGEKDTDEIIGEGTEAGHGEPGSLYIAAIRNLLDIINRNLEHVFMVKKGMTIMGEDPENIDMATADAFRKLDAYYMDLSDEELERELFEKMS